MAKYTVKAGDSWARIAGKLYGGDQRFFNVLMSANAGIGMLHPGMVIEVPDISGYQKDLREKGQRHYVGPDDVALANLYTRAAGSDAAPISFAPGTAPSPYYQRILGQFGLPTTGVSAPSFPEPGSDAPAGTQPVEGQTYLYEYEERRPRPQDTMTPLQRQYAEQHVTGIAPPTFQWTPPPPAPPAPPASQVGTGLDARTRRLISELEPSQTPRPYRPPPQPLSLGQQVSGFLGVHGRAAGSLARTTGRISQAVRDALPPPLPPLPRGYADQYAPGGYSPYEQARRRRGGADDKRRAWERAQANLRGSVGMRFGPPGERRATPSARTALEVEASTRANTGQRAPATPDDLADRPFQPTPGGNTRFEQLIYLENQLTRQKAPGTYTVPKLIGYQRDAQGNLILDPTFGPIPIYGEAVPVPVRGSGNIPDYLVTRRDRTRVLATENPMLDIQAYMPARPASTGVGNAYAGVGNYAPYVFRPSGYGGGGGGGTTGAPTIVRTPSGQVVRSAGRYPGGAGSGGGGFPSPSSRPAFRDASPAYRAFIGAVNWRLF